uniref:IF rod domain-containing protein n=1 Tax=Caenorhabditis tropicalis TaxID=1561998 RepID=A0A1I7SZS7_9PELO
MADPLNSTRLTNHPALARIIESGRTNLPTGITTSGALSAYAQNAAAIIRDNREREKVEIADLNNRLARYVEKVRFLEAQNRVLENDIEVFRHAATTHADRIGVYFESEKNSLAVLVRENKAKISSAEQNIRKLEPEVIMARKNLESSSELRKKMREDKRSQMKKLSDLAAENDYTKRLITDCEEEKSHISTEILRLRAEIKRVIALRDKERSKYSSGSQELLKRLNGSITQHEMAIREEINKARRDTTDKNRDYFHKELHASMKEIRDQFDRDSRSTRKTWEDWYHKKISEIKKSSEAFSINQNHAREEILRIRSIVNEFRGKLSDAETMNQQLLKRIDDLHYQDKENLRLFELALTEKENSVIKMREECTKLSVELDKLVENQINLRNEINHYRKLMENAEHLRTTAQSHVIIDTLAPGLRTTSYHAYGSAYAEGTTSSLK